MDPKLAIKKYMGTTKQDTDDRSLDKVVGSKLRPISSTYVKSITYGCKEKFVNIALTKEKRIATQSAARKRYEESPVGIATRKRYEESPKRVAYRESLERIAARKQ